MEETKVSDMTLDRDGGTMSYSEMRAYVLKFKYWLQEHRLRMKMGPDE
ncbi:MAG: hypothetical protein ACLU30_19415 [Odoribacter splanchnicus]